MPNAYIELFDRTLKAKDEVEKIESSITTALKHAGACSVLMEQNRIPSTGEMIRDIEIGVADLNALVELMKENIEGADNSLKTTALLAARIKFSHPLGTDARKMSEYERDLGEAMTANEIGTENTLMLIEQITRSIADLTQLLPI